MRLRYTAVVALLALFSGSEAYAQARALPEFTGRVAEYMELRRSLETGTAVLMRASSATEIDFARRELAHRIGAARARAVRGDVFTPSVAGELIRRVRDQLDGNTWAALMDDNPGELPCEVNGRYPEGMPLSRVPANLLSVLPSLPNGLEYRFLGRHLLLHDSAANLIVDYVPYVLARCDCDQQADEDDR